MLEKSVLIQRLTNTLCPCFGKCDGCGLLPVCDIPKMVNKLVEGFELGWFSDNAVAAQVDNAWKSVEDELPIKDSPDELVIHQSIGVIVYIEGETKPAYRIYERATVRDKVVYRWKYPWDRISDEKITHWRYLPEKE